MLDQGGAQLDLLGERIRRLAINGLVQLLELVKLPLQYELVRLLPILGFLRFAFFILLQPLLSSLLALLRFLAPLLGSFLALGVDLVFLLLAFEQVLAHSVHPFDVPYEQLLL